jgi:hypothetical protein
MSESPPPTALPARILALKSKEVSDRRKSLPTPQSSQTQTSGKRRLSESTTNHANTRPMRKPRQASTVTVPSEGEVSDTDSEPLSDPPSESDSEVEAAPHAASSASSTGLGLSATPSVRSEATRPSGRPPPRKRPSPPRTTTRVRLSVAAPPPPQAEPEKTQNVSLSRTHQSFC